MNCLSPQTYGGFLKWWYPTTFGFPTKNDHFGVFWGYHHLRKHPYIHPKSPLLWTITYPWPTHFWIWFSENMWSFPGARPPQNVLFWTLENDFPELILLRANHLLFQTSLIYGSGRPNPAATFELVCQQLLYLVEKFPKPFGVFSPIHLVKLDHIISLGIEVKNYHGLMAQHLCAPPMKPNGQLSLKDAWQPWSKMAWCWATIRWLFLAEKAEKGNFREKYAQLPVVSEILF